jgi:hypothetical protein
LFGLILGLIGVVLYLIAHAMTKRSVAANPRPGAYGSAYPPPPMPPPPPPNAQTWAPPSGNPGDASPPPPSDQVPPPAQPQ